MVLQAILAALDGGNPLDWVSAPRWHHQYLPDQILHEPNAFTEPEQQALRAQGHRLESTANRYGNMQLIQWDRAKNRVRAISDPRGIGDARLLPDATPAGLQSEPPDQEIRKITDVSP